MTVARNTEITALSNTSFEDAIQEGLARAKKTLRNVKSAWIKEQQVMIGADGADKYEVTMKVTFVLDD